MHPSKPFGKNAKIDVQSEVAMVPISSRFDVYEDNIFGTK
jgi:hypothetical protein